MSRLHERQKQSPERFASQALVRQAREKMSVSEDAVASDLLQESITLDPQNGESFYYLALVKIKLGEHETASVYLDRARDLLSHDEEWMEKIQKLQELSEQQP